MSDNIRIVENATCTFCGCVCDDQILTVDDDAKRITKVLNTCALGLAWFTEHYDEKRPVATIDGRAAGLEEAVALFEEGQGYLKVCRERLGVAQRRIEELTAADLPPADSAADDAEPF